jgi:hypothetical protein
MGNLSVTEVEGYHGTRWDSKGWMPPNFGFFLALLGFIVQVFVWIGASTAKFSFSEPAKIKELTCEAFS